jgi:hypothetical protein
MPRLDIWGDIVAWTIFLCLWTHALTFVSNLGFVQWLLWHTLWYWQYHDRTILNPNSSEHIYYNSRSYCTPWPHMSSMGSTEHPQTQHVVGLRWEPNTVTLLGTRHEHPILAVTCPTLPCFALPTLLCPVLTRQPDCTLVCSVNSGSLWRVHAWHVHISPNNTHRLPHVCWCCHDQ